MPLEELVLQAKSLGVAPGAGQDSDGVTSFLLKAMDPPQRLSIENAIGLLQVGVVCVVCVVCLTCV